ncbi:MAG: MFS transporter, partial [Acidimicrobiia bacterium]
GTVTSVLEQVSELRGRDLIRRGPFARLWWSQAVSSLGDWVTLFASFALAARIAGGGRGASLAILVPLVGRILPGLIFGIVGGVIADRWSRKATMLAADFGRAALAAGLLFVENYRELFLVTFLTEMLSMVRQPAREAVVPRLIPERHLLAANGLSLLSNYGTAPIGSALFAALSEIGSRLPDFGSFGPSIGAAFVFDAATFVASAIIVLFTPIPEVELSKARRSKGRLDLRTPLRDIVEGFRFVTRKGPIRRMILGMAAGLFGGGALFVIGQPFAQQVLRVSNSGYGLIVTALGVGVAIGMLGVTILGSMNTRRQVVFGLALLMIGLAIVSTGFTNNLSAAAAWTLLTGLGTGVAYVTGFTQLHATVDDELRGRTFAAMFAFARIALLVSFALAGVGAAALDGIFAGELNEGIRAVIVLGGAVVLIAGGAVLWAAREELRPKPLDADQLATLAEAGDAITWMRGDRSRRRQAPPEEE